MIRRSSATIHGLLGISVLATLLAGCGAAKTTAPAQSARPSATPSSTAVPSAIASSSVAVSSSAAPSATPEPTLPLPHADAVLEDKLPSTVNGVALVKTSLMLEGYIASPPAGGDKALYPPWLVKFGKIPSDVKIAVALSFAEQMTFQARAIEVPGVSAAALSSGFADVARKAGWTVVSHVNYLPGKSILDIIDPATSISGIVYANGDVMYEIITDDQNLVNEALILLP
jgi:hypothetical protein